MHIERLIRQDWSNFYTPESATELLKSGMKKSTILVSSYNLQSGDLLFICDSNDVLYPHSRQSVFSLAIEY